MPAPLRRPRAPGVRRAVLWSKGVLAIWQSSARSRPCRADAGVSPFLSTSTRRMVQAWNWPAVRVTARVLFRQPALALPHVEVQTIGDLNFRKLRAAGCEGIVFDKDNTLTCAKKVSNICNNLHLLCRKHPISCALLHRRPYVDTLDPSLTEALAEAREAFDGRVAVLSNSAGTPDDPGYKTADRLERALGMPVLRRPEKKPRGFESVRAHFGSGVDPATLVMVGDRYLTDVTFGNLHGMLCVRTAQLTRQGDNPVAQAMRALEVVLVSLFRWARVPAQRHRLAEVVARTCVRPRRGETAPPNSRSGGEAKQP